MNKIEKIIKNIVQREFPSAGSTLSYKNTEFTQIPADREIASHDVRDVGDGSGRQYFMWGISKWSDGDIVGE